MLGGFQLQQIHKSTPNGQNTILSRVEILSVSNSHSVSSFQINTYTKSQNAQALLFLYVQCSCTHQAKTQWFKSLSNPTRTATSKIQSCTWTMATLSLILLQKEFFTSQVESLATVGRARSSTLLQGMALLTLLHMVQVCRILLRLTPPFSAQFRHRLLLLHHHKVFHFW